MFPAWPSSLRPPPAFRRPDVFAYTVLHYISSLAITAAILLQLIQLHPARVTVVVRVRPPESAAGTAAPTTALLSDNHYPKDIAVFPAIGGQDTIVVDRDGSEARCVIACVGVRLHDGSESAGHPKRSASQSMNYSSMMYTLDS